MKRVRLAKLSACECGFPLLQDGIPVGTEYLVDEARRDSITLTCGGCKKTFPLAGIFVFPRRQSDTHGGWLPEIVFEDL
jgi:hypothetical protein